MQEELDACKQENKDLKKENESLERRQTQKYLDEQQEERKGWEERKRKRIFCENCVHGIRDSGKIVNYRMQMQQDVFDITCELDSACDKYERKQ